MLALAELAQIDRVETCAAAAAACRMAGRAAEARTLLEEAPRYFDRRRIDGWRASFVAALARSAGNRVVLTRRVQSWRRLWRSTKRLATIGRSERPTPPWVASISSKVESMTHCGISDGPPRYIAKWEIAAMRASPWATRRSSISIKAVWTRRVRAYEQALAIAREIGDRRVEGMVLGNLSIVLHELGKRSEAQRLYETALSIHCEVGNRRFESNVLCNLGNLLLEQGQVDEALRHYESALPISQELGDVRQQGLVLSNLGNVRHQRGDAMALETYEEALAMHVKVGNRRDQESCSAFLPNFSRLRVISKRR